MFASLQGDGSPTVPHQEDGRAAPSHSGLGRGLRWLTEAQGGCPGGLSLPSSSESSETPCPPTQRPSLLSSAVLLRGAWPG